MADDVGVVQVRAALGFIAQRAEPNDRLTVELKLGGVVQAQNDVVAGYALRGAGGLGLKNFPPVGALVAQHAEGGLGFTPTATGSRSARRGVVCKLCKHLQWPFVQFGIAQIDRRRSSLTQAHSFQADMSQLGGRGSKSS